MIFLDFSLPNATTWSYFSFLLAVALFFKFSRLLSVRNWDVVTLFLLVPGLLLLHEPGAKWFGYLWLLGGSAYFLGRCLIDLTFVQRPALSANLNLGGLAWLAGALFISLITVVIRQPDARQPMMGKGTVALEEATRRAEHIVQRQAEANQVPRFNTRLWVGRSLAILCHLAICIGLVVVGCRHFQDAHVGMAVATFYLLLPYTASHFGQWHHAWPAALVLWAVAAYRRPLLAGLLLGLAAGTVYFPILILPLWLSFYRGRGTGRFLGGFILTAGFCLAAIGTILWSDGELAAHWQSVLSLSDWQPWKQPSADTEGFWTGVRWAYRLPVFIAYLALVTMTTFWPARKNLAHVLALSAATLLGIQFWYADQGGVYVLWYLPLLLLVIFRPNLSDRLPAPIQAETDWLFRLGRFLVRLGGRIVRLPEPLTHSVT